MIQFEWCKCISIDGHYFLEGALGLDWFPSSRAKQEAARYEREVAGQLNQLVRYNWSGLAVLWAISRTGKSIKIVPDRKWEEDRVENANTRIQGWDGVRNVPKSAITGGAPALIEYRPGSAGALT